MEALCHTHSHGDGQEADGNETTASLIHSLIVIHSLSFLKKSLVMWKIVEVYGTKLDSELLLVQLTSENEL